MLSKRGNWTSYKHTLFYTKLWSNLNLKHINIFHSKSLFPCLFFTHKHTQGTDCEGSLYSEKQYPPLNLGDPETGYLTETNLLAISLRISQDWRCIGMNLGISYQELDRIHYKHRWVSVWVVPRQQGLESCLPPDGAVLHTSVPAGVSVDMQILHCYYTLYVVYARDIYIN